MSNGGKPGTEQRRGRILVIDDQAGSRQLLERALTSLGYVVETAADGIEGMAKVRLDVDLVVLDAQMPGMDGFEVARQIRADPALEALPVLMVTGLDNRTDRLRAVEAGVNDFLGKPFDQAELRLRVASLLRTKAALDALRRHEAFLAEEVERRTLALRRALDDMVTAQREAQAAHLDTVRRLVLAAERRDDDTARHIERIGQYCAMLGRELGLPPGEVELWQYASQMHDVGKIGVPDHVLLKPGKLTEQEWELMRQHTTIGAELLRGSPSPLLQLGEEIALCHHERWDGSGYPQGMSGEVIPLPARVCAVADVFDATTEPRPYREALPNDVVFRMMSEQRGRHFDPEVLDLFLARREEVVEIQQRFRDVPARPGRGA